MSSALGQQLGLQDVLLQVEIARQPGRAVFAAPHTEQATLPHEWPLCLVEARKGDAVLESSPCTEVLCPTAVVCWLSQP